MHCPLTLQIILLMYDCNSAINIRSISVAAMGGADAVMLLMQMCSINNKRMTVNIHSLGHLALFVHENLINLIILIKMI